MDKMIDDTIIELEPSKITTKPEPELEQVQVQVQVEKPIHKFIPFGIVTFCVLLMIIEAIIHPDKITVLFALGGMVGWLISWYLALTMPEKKKEE